MGEVGARCGPGGRCRRGGRRAGGGAGVTAAATTVGGARHRLARAVTEVLAPIVQIVVVTLVVSLHAGGFPRGLLLGLVAVLFAGGIPFTVLMVGIRLGRFSDRHVTRREERPAIFTVGPVSVVVGFLVMRSLDAPPAIYALVVAMVAGVAVTVAVSLFWKISVHTGCAGGSVAVLAILVSPWLVLLAPLVVLVAWSRVVVEHHSVGEVVAGGLVGAAVAAGVCLALT